jgi:hypothetical protein
MGWNAPDMCQHFDLPLKWWSHHTLDDKSRQRSDSTWISIQKSDLHRISTGSRFVNGILYYSYSRILCCSSKFTRNNLPKSFNFPVSLRSWTSQILRCKTNVLYLLPLVKSRVLNDVVGRQESVPQHWSTAWACSPESKKPCEVAKILGMIDLQVDDSMAVWPSGVILRASPLNPAPQYWMQAESLYRWFRNRLAKRPFLLPVLPYSRLDACHTEIWSLCRL